MLEAAYTYHMTENMGLEFGVAATHANAELIRAVEAGRATVLDDTYAGIVIGESLLVWSPIYGKLELGGSVVHFDIHLDLGVGVVDAQTSRGAVGVAGVGIKLFAGNAVAFRIDFRDRTYQQQLLDDNFIVNDIAVTAGFSVFLPFSN